MQLSGIADDFCANQNVIYDHRVYNPDEHNWCPVPGGGADALLFAGLAVFSSCALYSKLSAIWVLLAGACFQLLSFYYNLNHFTNALTIWLGMHPSTIFFQIFLPPLLLDSAVRVDFFLFKKMAAHVLLFAFVNVVVSTLAFIPILLYGLNLASVGWRAVDAALFGAMLGSTDAVAVTAILKAGGAPEMLSALLEGESLFNDASSIVLFEIFLHLGMSDDPGAADFSLGDSAWHIVKLIGWLSVSGAAAGLVMGWATRWLMKLLHRRRVPPPAEVAVSLAGAYTVYLCTEYYIHGSGVIAVVVFGLHGASSYLWGFSSKGMRQGAFFKFWDVVSFVTNGMVFFFVGASVMNFMLSVTVELFEGGSAAALLTTIQALPVIIAAMFFLRWALMTLEAPLLSLVGPALSWRDVLFSALGGLRGGLALILVQTVLASHGTTKDAHLKVVHAVMALWVSAVVLFTLTVNAPALGPLMTALGLNKTTPAQRHMHRRAYAALSQYTKHTIEDLQADDDEMLRGVDWTAVTSGSDICKAAKRVLRSSDTMQGQQSSVQSIQPKDAHHQQPGKSRLSVGFRSDSSALDGEDLDSSGGGLGLRGPSFDVQTQNPMVLTRASLARASTLSMVGLTVPLLGRQYSSSSKAAERYSAPGTGDDSSSEDGGDLETGTQQQKGIMPQVVAESNSEAVFIASRLQEQDEQIAKHAAEASDCPFLAAGRRAQTTHSGSSDGSSSGADVPAAGDGGGSDGSLGPGLTDAGDGEEGLEVGPDGGSDGEAAVQDEAVAAAAADQVGTAAAGSGGAAQPKFRLLAPLIVLQMTDTLGVPGVEMRGAHGYIHSAALPKPAADAAAAAGYSAPSSLLPAVTAAAGGPAAAAGAASGSSSRDFRKRAALGTAGGTAAAAGYAGGIAGGSGLASGLVSWGSGGGLGPSGVLRHGSLRVRSSLWQQHVAPYQGWLPEQAQGYVSGAKLAGEFDTISEVSDDDEMTHEEYLEECRVSLLAGLKRHFRFKAAEGLLSKTSLRVLDYACDASLSKPQQPLHLWSTIRHDIKNRGLTGYTAALHYKLRTYQTSLLRSTSGGGGVSFLWQWLLLGPLNRASLLLRNRLGNVALTVLEVALELWLALTASPQARILKHSTTMASGILQEELRAQADAVWRFIMDRQIEAPDEFASLQTHRVQLAVARRQLGFVEQLAEVGAVDEAAAEALQEMVERRLHRLESRGPSWRSPSLTDVLRRQPCLAGEDDSMLLWLRAYGELKSYSPGQCMVPRRRTGPPGIFIVLSGLVRVEVVRCGRLETHFVGVGGSVGFVSSLLGRQLPGVGLVTAFAQGNALGRGPLVLHLPLRLLATIKQRAAPAAQLQPASSATAATQLSPVAVTGYGNTAMPADGSSSSSGHPQSRFGMLSLPAGLGPGVTGGGTWGGTGGDTTVSLNAAAFAQLLLDMHRQAGVMLLDRMGDGVVQQLAQHVETAVKAIFDYASQLPAPKSQAKLQRLLEALLGSNTAAAEAAGLAAHFSSSSSDAAGRASVGTGVAVDEVAGVVAQPRVAQGVRAVDFDLQAEGEAAGAAAVAMQLVTDCAAAAALKMRDLLRAADLVTLEPGYSFTQSSSIMLLNGCLRLHNSSSSSKRDNSSSSSQALPSRFADAAGGSNNSSCGSLRQFNAPTLIAWGPELFEDLEERYEPKAPLLAAGPRGALLLMTPGTGSDATTSGSSDPSAAQPSSTERPGQQQQQQVQAVGQQQPQKQRFERLSSGRPLHRTTAPGVGPEQDAV